MLGYEYLIHIDSFHPHNNPIKLVSITSIPVLQMENLRIRAVK